MEGGLTRGILQTLVVQGLTFNFDTNIRTVMFEFIGVEYPEDLIGDICNLVKKIQNENDFSNKIRKYLEQNEIDGLITRAKSILYLVGSNESCAKIHAM